MVMVSIAQRALVRLGLRQRHSQLLLQFEAPRILPELETPWVLQRYVRSRKGLGGEFGGCETLQADQVRSGREGRAGRCGSSAL